MACKIRIRVKKKKYIRGDNTTMKYTSIIIPFVGGLGMFIYGMQIMAQGLENAAGNRMKSLLEALTKNKFFGVLLGAFITAVIQSSSATTVMVVGFVNAGIMNLQQAMGVIMGANIGTTVTGWLVSSVEWAKFLSPSNLAPVAIMIGVIIMLTGKRRSTKDIASIVVGFGLLFVGISSMSSAVEPLKDNAAFCNIFVSRCLELWRVQQLRRSSRAHLHRSESCRALQQQVLYRLAQQSILSWDRISVPA